MDIMASSGQRKGGCCHITVNFNTHIRCARYIVKGSGSDPCVMDKTTVQLTPEQSKQLATHPLTSSVNKGNLLLNRTFGGLAHASI